MHENMSEIHQAQGPENKCAVTCAKRYTQSKLSLGGARVICLAAAGAHILPAAPTMGTRQPASA